MLRFQQVLHEIKPQRPDFACLIGWEELLCASMFMGGDGGTLSSAGVVPEVIMKIYGEARAGNWSEARRVQYKLLDLFSLMVNAPNFPEGFRAGYEARGFQPGRARFPLSEHELAIMDEVLPRITCVLVECGFKEAARSCASTKSFPTLQQGVRDEVEAIVRKVLKGIHG